MVRVVCVEYLASSARWRSPQIRRLGRGQTRRTQNPMLSQLVGSNSLAGTNVVIAFCGNFYSLYYIEDNDGNCVFLVQKKDVIVL